jgi:hypothetical protein
MQLRTVFPGHGPVIDKPAGLIEERLGFHSERLGRIADLVDTGADTAFAISQQLWSEEVAATQTVLAIWEVLGHLDILVHRGSLVEDVDPDGHHSFHPTEAIDLAAARH